MSTQYFIALSLAALAVTGCTTTPKRIQPGGTTAVTTMGVDLADFQAAASAMVKELLVDPSITEFTRTHNGQRPALKVGQITNKSDVYLDMNQLAGRINEDLLRGGIVRLVATEAGATDQKKITDWENDVKNPTASRADFMLEGSIMLLKASEGSTKEKTYTFQLKLNDTKTLSTVWMKTYDLSKQTTKTLLGW